MRPWPEAFREDTLPSRPVPPYPAFTEHRERTMPFHEDRSKSVAVQQNTIPSISIHNIPVPTTPPAHQTCTCTAAGLSRYGRNGLPSSTALTCKAIYFEKKRAWPCAVPCVINPGCCTLHAPLISPSSSTPQKSSVCAATSSPNSARMLSRRFSEKPVAQTITSAWSSVPSVNARPVRV